MGGAGFDQGPSRDSAIRCGKVQSQVAERSYGVAIWLSMGSMAAMKTTLDIHDELLVRAKRHAQQTGRPLRAVVEDGLRQVLSTPRTTGYEMPDLRVGDPQDPDPLERYSWPELRELIYGGDGP